MNVSQWLFNVSCQFPDYLNGHTQVYNWFVIYSLLHLNHEGKGKKEMKWNERKKKSKPFHYNINSTSLLLSSNANQHFHSFIRSDYLLLLTDFIHYKLNQTKSEKLSRWKWTVLINFRFCGKHSHPGEILSLKDFPL